MVAFWSSESVRECQSTVPLEEMVPGRVPVDRAGNVAGERVFKPVIFDTVPSKRDTKISFY